MKILHDSSINNLHNSSAGIGISSAVVSFNVALYYNTIIAWCLFYFAQSFQSKLPWAKCPNIFFLNGSYATEPECEVSVLNQSGSKHILTMIEIFSEFSP